MNPTFPDRYARHSTTSYTTLPYKQRLITPDYFSNMFSQPIPGSEKTMDEFWNQPIRKVAEKCLRLGSLETQLVLNAFDSDPEGFKVALANTFQHFSDERKAQRLRRDMGTMTDVSLFTMRSDHSNSQRTLHDIDEELHDRTIRERIVAAAVRAIENNTRISWDHDLLESDKVHILWKRCERYVLKGEDGFFFDPTSDRSVYSPTLDSLMNRSAQLTPSAEEACMERVKRAKQLP